jgi:S-adenosylmethionine hydrolase
MSDARSAKQKTEEPARNILEAAMDRPIITLTTDFGLKDPYVAGIKAVVLDICPAATIVDISHEIEKFNIRMGAYILASASPYFPKGTIHVAVVDPGVGTKRKPILIQTKQAYFIGPDNGILSLAARNRDIEHIYEITNQNLMLAKISDTFHGRDLFAPTAAHLANGTPPADFGPQTRKIVTPDFTRVIRKKNTLIGEVLYIDSFGNIITNIDKKKLTSIKTRKTVNIKLGNTRLTIKLCRSYTEERPQKPLAIIGSHNFLEIAINQGNASKTLEVNVGEKVVLARVPH